MTHSDIIALYDALYPVMGTLYVGLLAIRIMYRLS